MRTRFLAARLVDPTHLWHDQLVDIDVEGDRVVSLVPHNEALASALVADTDRGSEGARDIQSQHDMSGSFVMSGGIDLHTHIGGGKLNLARLLMQEQLRSGRALERGPLWSSSVTGQRYATMGYTACFEPAMLLPQARATHQQLADTPLIDSGAYVVMGNEDWLLSALGRGVEQPLIDELVAWNVKAAGALAVKVVNAGGINAFKFNGRSLDVDQAHPFYGATPRSVIAALSAAVDNIGLAHPLHVHASNLGMPGNIAAALATLDAAGGRRLHLTHAQFNAYTTEGPMGMGSGAVQLAERINRSPELSLDVGQIVFGQTVTISADAAAQMRNRRHAHPARSIVSDVECVGGCGVVPMRYQSTHYVSSLQWTIGLELLLLIENPYQVLLTTDHPNGGPFTCYPHLIRLLMDRSFRQAALAELHPLAAERTLLKSLEREYSLAEIAILTRNAPARLLGLHDRGHLAVGQLADLVFYNPQSDWEATFQAARSVWKAGIEIVRDGQVVGDADAVPTSTIAATVQHEASLSNQWRAPIEQALSLPCHYLEISSDEFSQRTSGARSMCMQSSRPGARS